MREEEGEGWRGGRGKKRTRRGRYKREGGMREKEKFGGGGDRRGRG